VPDEEADIPEVKELGGNGKLVLALKRGETGLDVRRGLRTIAGEDCEGIST
jgi:hypothetical protein